MSEEQTKEIVEQVGYREFYRYFQEKTTLIEQQREEIERLNNIINETKEYLEHQISQLDFYEDTKAKMLGSMAIVLLKGSDKE